MMNDWTKKNKNEWVWKEDNNFTLVISKLEGMQFYQIDIWWNGHAAEVNGWRYRADVDFEAQEFLINENPRDFFEEKNKFILENIGYKKEELK